MKPVIALTKGRLENQFLNFFEDLGYDTLPLKEKGRKLKVSTDAFDFIFAKGPDVPTYVQYGIADLGIVGGDILAEDKPDVFDLCPLPFGYCDMAVAVEEGKVFSKGKKRIASKYTEITKDYYKRKGESVDIIKLNGSVELAPILGLADGIVDIVETGNTLKENGLVVFESFMSFSARLIANRASLKIKRDVLNHVIDQFERKGR